MKNIYHDLWFKVFYFENLFIPNKSNFNDLYLKNANNDEKINIDIILIEQRLREILLFCYSKMNYIELIKYVNNISLNMPDYLCNDISHSSISIIKRYYNNKNRLKNLLTIDENEIPEIFFKTPIHLLENIIDYGKNDHENYYLIRNIINSIFNNLRNYYTNHNVKENITQLYRNILLLEVMPNNKFLIRARSSFLGSASSYKRKNIYEMRINNLAEKLVLSNRYTPESLLKSSNNKKKFNELINILVEEDFNYCLEKKFPAYQYKSLEELKSKATTGKNKSTQPYLAGTSFGKRIRKDFKFLLDFFITKYEDKNL